MSLQIRQPGPMAQPVLIRSVYGYINAIDMFKCARVSKSWNIASKNPTFHPDRVEACLAFMKFPRAQSYYGTNIRASEIPEARFKDVAALVSKFDLSSKTYIRYETPQYILTPSLFTGLNMIALHETSDIPPNIISFIDHVSPRVMEINFMESIFDNTVQQISCPSVELISIDGNCEAYPYDDPANLEDLEECFPNAKAFLQIFQIC